MLFRSAGEAILPTATTAPPSSAVEIERLEAAEALYQTLAALRQPTPLSHAVLAETYNETAYRLSLLALLGDPEIGKEGDVMADLARLPLRLDDSDGQIEPDHPEVASLSNARLLPPGA